jgi:dolichol-phosphate mannosyltransferase
MTLLQNSEDRAYSLSVVVMAYNEEENVGPLLDELVAWLDAKRFSDWEVLVVDDGSLDATAARVSSHVEREPRIRLLRHERNLGMGAAIRTGYAAARCDFVTQLPADHQVPPATLDLFLSHLPHTDLVLSVYTDRGDGWSRRLMSAGYRVVAKALLGQRADYTGTMVFRRKLLDSIPLITDSFVVNLELPLKALKRGASFRIVHFAPSPRRSGQSKVLGYRRIANVVRELVELRRLGI